MLSCEHGGREVPPAFAQDFEQAEEALASHRGYDLGALPLARELAEAWQAPLVYSTVTRLLVELNRSPHHPRWLSEWTRHNGTARRQHLRDWLYDPYRAALARQIESSLAGGRRVLHVSVHSFTPLWQGVERRVDLGLLYDPRRPAERLLGEQWAASLREQLPAWRVRRNQPYRGAADGLTTAFRKRWPDPDYLGVELEIRNDWLDERSPPPALVEALVRSLARLCDHNT